jgi:hypothetical protein
MKLEEIIITLVNTPSKENVEKYSTHIHESELFLLTEAENFPFKSRDYFNKRTEAFSYRRNSASILISKWVEKYKTTKDCPVSYADTLNIPFQKINPAK